MLLTNIEKLWVIQTLKKLENGTIRKKIALNVQENSVHGSDSLEENAKIEIEFFLYQR